MMNHTRIVTDEVRFSYVHLLKPRENRFGGDPSFSVTCLLPKSNVACKQRLDQAIQAAVAYGIEKKWGGVRPAKINTPIYDGDGVRKDGESFGPECKGHWVFVATSKADEEPHIFGPDNNRIINHTEIYSGMYGQVAIKFGPYNTAGNKGIGCYISKNVKKTRDGEPLGFVAPSVEEDFGAGFFPAPAPQIPAQQYAQPPQQTWQAQQPYAQPAVAPPAQPQGFPQPAINPVTGQPYSGIMGV